MATLFILVTPFKSRVRDNIYILTDNSGSECAWLDANFINNTDPNLLQTIKDTLNLKDKK